MAPGRFIPPDPSRGDENTIGGYMAVHDRPAAFEGCDGMSYSVAIETDRTNEDGRPWGAYFLFVRWRRIGTQGVEGHLESPFLAHGGTAREAADTLGAMSLSSVKDVLDGLIRRSDDRPARRWWDVMRDEGDQA